MKIDRSQIIEDLFRFSQKGNGIIVGRPGIGKSYSIAELAEFLTEKNIPSFIISIDTLLDGTDKSIEDEIEAEGDWISYIDQIKLSGDYKAVLIFDAFDAARDEKLRKEILRQIHKAISRLKKWNVLVSARTYDATKSPKLIRLFGNENYGEHIPCRHYEIPELNEQELASVFKNDVGLEQFYEAAYQELKDVLKIPFFLSLLEIVLKDAEVNEIEEIKLIKSETELLDKYWDKKVANTEHSYKKESFLTSLANNLVQQRTMSTLKADFVQDEDIFKELRSDDLINEVGVVQKYIAFSHNILFDYIVGRVVIPPGPEELLGFINIDGSRPFFLRPSFIFHFTRLWYHYRSKFWRNFTFLNTQTEIKVLLFKRLILTSVVANEFESVSEVKIIFESEANIQQLLQAIRFLSDRKIQERDMELLYKLRNTLDIIFLWDYAFIFDIILKDENLNKEINIEKLGIISRCFLRYILDTGKASPEVRPQLDRLGSARGIEFVSKTFNSNPKEATKLLREILDLLKEPYFEIWYFSSLCEDLKYFISDAPAFVSEIYQRIFSHTETSDAKTNMGTVTLNLTSNRRQDFDMCYYRLVELYPTFLTESPNIAIETGLSIVNTYIKKEKLHVNNVSESLPEIHVKEIRTHFLADLSSIWHDSLVYNKPAELVEKIIDFFKQLASENKVPELTESIDIYISNALVGFMWKKLIEFGNDYPQLLLEYLYELALNPVILESSDTTYEIGISLEKIFPLLKKEQREKVEKTILNLLNVDDEYRKSYTKHKVNRLLNCLPKELLQSKEARIIVENSEPVKNEPTYKSSWSSEPFTTDKWLEEQGVDLKNPGNKEIYNQLSVLQEFNHANINDTLLRGKFVDLLPIAGKLLKRMTGEEVIDNELEFSALTEIAKFYSIISQDSSQINKEDYHNAKRAIQYCLRYISKHDQSFDNSKSPSAGYSPTPRIEASGALIGLYAYNAENDILEDIKKYMKDSNPVVRFNVLRNIGLLWQFKPTEYWEIIFECLANEPDSFTVSAILNNVYLKGIIDVEENINQAIGIVAKRIDEFGKSDSFTKAYSGLLLYLLDNKKNEVAKKIIYDHIENPDFIRTLIFRMFDFIDPKYKDNDYTVENTRKELIQLLVDIAARNLDLLREDNPTKFSEEGSLERKRLFLIDFLIQRIYFGLSINEAIRSQDKLKPSEKNKIAFYDRIKPILLNVVNSSKKIGGGIMVAHTAHYLIQTLNGVLKFYPEECQSILKMTSKITTLAQSTGYTFDPSSIREVVSLTETILADHKELLKNEDSFEDLISILNVYVESGRTEALELLWKLDEVFK